MVNMNKIRIILIITITILVVGSVGLNAHFGWKEVRSEIYQKGLQDGANSALNQIRNGVKVNLEDGTILFVPKTNQE